MASTDGDLVLGDILAAAGLHTSDVLAIRHTPSAALPADADSDAVLAYTREQRIYRSKIPARPPRTWLLFWSDGGRRSRFYGAYHNSGELPEERTDTRLYFDLSPTSELHSLRNRLVVEWPADTRNWAKRGVVAQDFPVIEIADALAFPGFDGVLLTYAELQQLANDPRYEKWRAALASVQGIYLIADEYDGRLYVGQAAGRDGILGRWQSYALTRHGGNRDLVELLANNPERASHFRYSLLRVFGLGTSPDEIHAAEDHYKRALLTRQFGLNGN